MIRISSHYIHYISCFHHVLILLENWYGTFLCLWTFNLVDMVRTSFFISWHVIYELLWRLSMAMLHEIYCWFDQFISHYGIDLEKTWTEWLCGWQRQEIWWQNSFLFLISRFLLQINFSFQFGQQTYDATGMAFGSQATRDYSRGPSPEWLHMQVGGGFERPSWSEKIIIRWQFLLTAVAVRIYTSLC